VTPVSHRICFSPTVKYSGVIQTQNFKFTDDYDLLLKIVERDKNEIGEDSVHGRHEASKGTKWRDHEICVTGVLIIS